jgi:hypothetical protein
LARSMPTITPAPKTIGIVAVGCGRNECVVWCGDGGHLTADLESYAPHHDGLCDQAAWFQQATCDPRNSIWHSEIDPNLLMQEHWYFGDYSECALIDHPNYLDFDSAIPRFESWRPSH